MPTQHEHAEPRPHVDRTLAGSVAVAAGTSSKAAAASDFDAKAAAYLDARAEFWSTWSNAHGIAAPSMSCWR